MLSPARSSTRMPWTRRGKMSRPKVPRRRLMVERLEGGKTARVLAKKKGRKEGREEGDGDMSVSFLFWDGRRVGKWITNTMLRDGGEADWRRVKGGRSVSALR